MNKELRELRVNVSNPTYDRRRKQGSESVESFVAGRRFVLCYYQPGFPERMVGLPQDLTFTDNGLYCSDADLVKLIFASSQVVQPETFRDLKVLNKIGADFTIQELLSDGVISINQIVTAQLKVQQRLDQAQKQWAKEQEAQSQPEIAPVS